jgi:hypothetical protein
MRVCGAWIVSAALVLSACASVPTGPSVLVLPGGGKPWEQFSQDERDMVYVQCMYAAGNDIPLPRAAATAPTTPEHVPPGTPTAAPMTWPPTPAQLDCERSGGVWRAALDFCEFPSPEVGPMRRWR